jgi:hypothetical protein
MFTDFILPVSSIFFFLPNWQTTKLFVATDIQAELDPSKEVAGIYIY